MMMCAQREEVIMALPPDFRSADLKVTVPGLDQMTSNLSKLQTEVSQLGPTFRRESRELVSYVVDQSRALAVAHNVGFFNGVGLAVVLALLAHFVFSRKK